MHSILIQSLAAIPAQDTTKSAAKPAQSAEGNDSGASFGSVFDETAEAASAPAPKRPEEPHPKSDPQHVPEDDADALLHGPKDGAHEEVDLIMIEGKPPKSEIALPKRVASNDPPIAATPEDLPQQTKVTAYQASTVVPAGAETPQVASTINARPTAAKPQTSASRPEASYAAAQPTPGSVKKEESSDTLKIPDMPLRQTDQQTPVKTQTLPTQARAIATQQPAISQSTKQTGEGKLAVRLDQIETQTQQSTTHGQTPRTEAAALPAQMLPSSYATNAAQEKRTRFDGPPPDRTASASSATPKTIANGFNQFNVMQPAVTPAAAETAKTSASLEIDPLSAPRTETSGTTTTAQSQSLPTRTELSQHISRQIAEALQNMPSRPIEIRLSPEELGRVRLGVSTSEGNIMVTVVAERPETNDLLRRHISTLETAFQELGYSDISFSFSGGDSAQPDSESSNEQGLGSSFRSSNDTTEQPVQLHLKSAPTTGVDIRL